MVPDIELLKIKRAKFELENICRLRLGDPQKIRDVM